MWRRYVPGLWVDQLDSLPDVGKNEINIVNQQLVNRLKSLDTAFSLGTSDKVGRFCLPIKSASKNLSSVMQK